jgi:hypothetical protein
MAPTDHLPAHFQRIGKVHHVALVVQSLEDEYGIRIDDDVHLHETGADAKRGGVGSLGVERQG